MTPAEFQKATLVSRETLDRLQAYVDLLTLWNRRINLVGPRTMAEIWRRHIFDSAQLLPLLPPGPLRLLDLGSGAGLPGLILAILGVAEVHLVESDARKAAFLREAARVTGASPILHARRAADVTPFPADVVTARAFAPLEELLDHAERFIADHSILLLMKGRTGEEELTRASKGWRMNAKLHTSLSDPSGIILQLKQVTRVG